MPRNRHHGSKERDLVSRLEEEQINSSDQYWGSAANRPLGVYFRYKTFSGFRGLHLKSPRSNGNEKAMCGWMIPEERWVTVFQDAEASAFFLHGVAERGVLYS